MTQRAKESEMDLCSGPRQRIAQMGNFQKATRPPGEGMCLVRELVEELEERESLRAEGSGA